MLAPVYVFCAWLMVSRLLERKPSLWVVTYAAAAVIVLVPSPLVEPRCELQPVSGFFLPRTYFYAFVPHFGGISRRPMTGVPPLVEPKA